MSSNTVAHCPHATAFDVLWRKKWKFDESFQMARITFPSVWFCFNTQNEEWRDLQGPLQCVHFGIGRNYLNVSIYYRHCKYYNHGYLRIPDNICADNFMAGIFRATYIDYDTSVGMQKFAVRMRELAAVVIQRFIRFIARRNFIRAAFQKRDARRAAQFLRQSTAFRDLPTDLLLCIGDWMYSSKKSLTEN